jgi:hypothetical protein
MTGAAFVNEVHANPLQLDINYRGFTGSPRLGKGQALSVYMDGVRCNQSFGERLDCMAADGEGTGFFMHLIQ